MTRRERYLKALHNEPVDALVWAPNIDYWLQVNRAEGTLPDKYVGLSRNEIVRRLGASLWNRASGLRLVRDAACVEERVREAAGGHIVRELVTRHGTLRQTHAPTEGPHRAKAITEHYVKTLEDLAVMQYIVEATRCEADPAPTDAAVAATGDEGIVLNSQFCVPFIEFAKTDVGYVNGLYMWMDEKARVDALLDAYRRLYMDGYRILARGAADVIATGDNMDGLMVSPAIFQEYAVPFYQEAAAIVHAGGKLLEGHWCGRTQTLLPLVPDCGLDVVEAIVTRPMADIALSEALDRLEGRVVLQGGVPSVLVCAGGGTRRQFEQYVQDVILPLRGRRGFILGMSDNTPPDADFERIEAVAALVACA